MPLLKGAEDARFFYIKGIRYYHYFFTTYMIYLHHLHHRIKMLISQAN